MKCMAKRHNKKSWKDRIKALQDALGYDNAQMAEALGISEDTLHSWKYRSAKNTPPGPGRKLIECLEDRLKKN